MDQAFKLLAIPSSFREVSGTCPQHGENTVLLHPRRGAQEWYCAACAEAERKAADQAAWLKSRAETLQRICCIPEKYIGKKFDAKTPEQKRVRMTVKGFRDAVAARSGWAVLVLMGTTGTGKTLLSCELAQSLIDNLSMSVRYCTANQMISEIQSAYGQDGKSEESEILRFSQYDVLILDEIDAKRNTENASLLLTEVINRRYNSERPVVAITNQPMEKLAQFVGDRVFSRLHENAFVCAFDWADYRVTGA
jgi:DNA replication protein DnaC